MAVFSGFRPFLTKGSTVNGVQNMFFSDNLPGFHYLPSVTEARNFSNATTFGQRVHSLQDLKLGAQTLGPELVTNGTFDSGTTGWSATGGSTNSVVDGKLNVIAAGASNGSFTVMTGLKIGSTYRILATINRNSATNVHVSVSASGSTEPRVYTYQSASDVGDVNIESYFVATATSHRIHVGRDCIGTTIYDNISVQEVLNASHALQSSASLTPLLGRSPRSRRNNMSDTVSTPGVSNGTLTLGSNITVGNASIPMWEFTIGATALPTISGVSRARPDSATVNLHYMYSVFVKPGANRYIYFSSNFGGVQNNVGSKFRYDTTTDTITAIYSGNVSNVYRGVQNLGNGVYWIFIRQQQVTNTGSKSVGVYCSSTSETTGSNSYITPTVAPDGIFSVGGWQSEIVNVDSISPSNYQEVTSSVDISESGVTSYPFIRLDLSDDVLTTANLVSQRNLLRYTEEFDDAYWTKQLSTTVGRNNIVAPDGTLTARTFTPTVQYSNVQRMDSRPLGTYTFSVYMRVASGTRSINIGCSTDGSYLKVAAKTVTETWQRFTYTFTHDNSFWSIGGAIQDRNTSGFVDVYIWGAQLESGSVATDYDYGGTKGTVVVAGKNGTSVETVYSPNGNFSLGPASYTGGTPGILRAVGDIVGYSLIGRSTTAVEQDQLLDFYKFRGAKGILTPGTELQNQSVIGSVQQFDGTAYNRIHGYFWGNLTGAANFTPDKCFIITAAVKRLSGSGVFRWRSERGTNYSLEINPAIGETFSYTAISQLTGASFSLAGWNVFMLEQYNNNTSQIELVTLSVKEIRPAEEW
jgi:hypothetical protein